jgi:hypothetical protein
MAISTRLRGAELVHEAGEVELDRAEADVEVVGDLGVGPTSSDCHEDLFLAFGEGNEWLPRVRGVRVLGEAGERAGGDARGDEGVTFGGGADGLEEKVGAGVPEGKAPGAALRARR